MQVAAEGCGGVEAAFLEDVGDVAAGQDDDGVSVFADFLVGLAVQLGGGDQDAELAVPQPGDEPAGLPDADAVTGRVALGFERELDRDRIRGGAEQVVTDRITSSVPPWPGDVDPVHVRVCSGASARRRLLEVVRPLPPGCGAAVAECLAGRELADPLA